MKWLQRVNLVGVLALAALCVVQWQRDRRLNLEINRLERVRLEQAARLEEQGQSARGLNRDLAQWKERFTRTQAELSEARGHVGTAEGETRQLAAERDQLKASVTNWVAAVAARDTRLSEAAGQVRKLSGELNASVQKFNELASNHNRVVRELNEARARRAPAP